MDETAPYAVRVVASNASVCLFDADLDWEQITKSHRKDKIDLVSSTTPGKSEIEFKVKDLKNAPHDFSMRTYCRERIEERFTNLESKKNIVVHGHALNNKPCTIQIALLLKDGSAFGAILKLDNLTENYELPLSKLKQVKSVLLPRPFPKFHAYWFQPSVKSIFNIKEVESIQISIGPGISEKEFNEEHGVAIAWVLLK